MYNKREKEVMELRKKGLSHKEIADKLGVTEKTSRQTMSNANRIKKFLENLKKDQSIQTMNPQFYLGLSIAMLFAPLGFVVGFNVAARGDIKKFNEKKLHIISGVIE